MMEQNLAGGVLIGAPGSKAAQATGEDSMKIAVFSEIFHDGGRAFNVTMDETLEER